MLRSLLALGLCATVLSTVAQYAPPDPSGFQGLIVETYYVVDTSDSEDLDGGGILPVGSTVYRVYADLKPGYRVLSVGGFTGHPFNISTSTSFFNNEDRGEAWGRSIPAQHLNKNTVAIDSWLTLGSASTLHWGVLKEADPDGSIVGGVNNDNGLLVNSVPAMVLPLTSADGLWSTGTAPPSVTSVGDAPDLFDAGGGNSYSNDNFAWAILGAYAVPDTANRVLLGQFTTDGEFNVCFNLTVRIPDSLVCDDPACHEFMEFYWELLPTDTAGGGFATQNRFTHPTLCYNSASGQVDCLGVPNGTALPGTPCDDGNADTSNDQYSAECVCWGQDCAGEYGGDALPGTPCDDGNPDTSDDVWQTGCICVGFTGLDERTSDILRISPNPTRDMLMVELASSGGPVRWEVRDLAGHVVLQGTHPGAGRMTLDMSGIATGAYLLITEREGVRGQHRVVKQ